MLGRNETVGRDENWQAAFCNRLIAIRCRIRRRSCVVKSTASLREAGE